MRALPRIRDHARCLLILFLLGGFWLSTALSAEPNQQAKTQTPAPKTEAATPKANEPTFEFIMRDKPWAAVFEWLNEHSGLPVIYSNKPSGTFNFVPPKDKNYTIPEIMDILNEGLLTQNFLLIRRDQSFLLVPATDKLDPSLVPRIRVEDLPKRGNTEMVSVTINLTAMVAEDMVSEIKELLGPYGKVVALNKANQLVITDTARNVKFIVNDIQNIEKNEKGLTESFSHHCEYIKARDAEKILKELLGDPEKQLRMQTPAFPGRGGVPGQVQMIRGPDGQMIPQGAAPPAANAPKIRMHYIAVDETTNTVLVAGPPDKIAQAKDILKRIDVGKAPIIQGPAGFETYTVPAGTADGLAKTLATVFKESSTLRISPAGNNKIIVYATPQDQLDIGRYIHKFTDKPIKSELIDLQNQDADKVVKILQQMFGEAKTGAPFIDADPSGRNAIVVRGAPEQIADVKAVLEAIGETGNISGNTRVISIDKGNAAVLAEALEEYLRGLRKNRVKVIIPGREPLPTPNDKKTDSGRDGSEEQEEPPAQQPEKAPPRKAPQDNKEKTPQEPGKQLFDPRAQSKEGAPITITVVGNRLIIQSEDAKALQMAQELARVLTQAPGGEGQFEIIKLKYANAVEVAKILDEMFSGNKQQQNQFNPYFFGFPGGRNRQQEDKNQPRIVADPATNALLVKASPLELATIRNLITKALDVPVGEGQFEVITLKHASADQVAKVLDEVFTGNKRNNQQDDLMARIYGFRGQQPTPTGTVRIVADTATNSLLVKASPQDMKIVHELLDKYLDKEPDSGAVAKTYVIGPLKYANANDVATLVKDVYREHINNNPVGGQTTGGFGGNPFSPFGFSRRSRSSSNQNVDANGNPRAVDLSIGIDDRSNSLVVMCSKALYEDVKKLADSLDDAARTSTRTIRVVQLQGVDPALVQQAIDAIQGRTTNGAQQQPGTPGFVPFGMGGMVPGSFRGTRGGASGSGGGSSGSSGGGGSRSGSSRNSGQQSRGPDFFAERVMDDPEPTILFDPQRARQSAYRKTHGAQPVGSDGDNLQLVKHEEQQPAPPTQQPLQGEPVRGPRSNVTAEALEQLGVIVITGNNPQDVEEILRVIEIIRRLSQGTEIKFQLVPLKNADASYVTFTLNQLFQRVQVGPSGNTPARPTGTTGAAPGQPGAAPGGTTSQAPTSVVLLPIPRQNAILVAAPEARLKDVARQISELDVPNAAPGKATAFPLKKASAARVDAQLNSFYASRYSSTGETQAVDQIRITHDDSTNTVYVQAAPADLAEISDLIARIDTTVSVAVNEIRIVPLKNVTSDEMATILQNAINQAIAIPTLGGTTPGGTTPGGTGPTGALPGGIPSGGTRPGGTFPGGSGPTGALPTTTPGAFPGTTGTGVGVQGQGTTTKSTTLRIVLPTRAGTRIVESGMLEDIHINSFPRLNSLVIAAPEKSMELLLTLIQAMDTLPSLHADLKVFTLTKADASAMAILLQQLFLGVGGISSPTTVTPGGGPGSTPGGIPGGVPGGTTGGGTPRQMTPLVLPGTSPEGAPLIELRLSVDTRTNSIIVAGSPNDVFAIELIIRKLEDTEVQARRNMVYHVRNSTAADLANALTTFSTSSLQVLTRGGILTPYQDVLREVVVVPEPITNKLLISATPQYYDEAMRLIIELDAEPPQVVIQILIAEVDLTNTDEFGVELGLQSPVLFQRGVFPATGFTGSTTITNTSSGTTVGLGEVPPGASVGGANPVAQPGFAFNSVAPLGNNPAANAGVVGFQGINNLGVGRMSPNAPVGGFVFSAASDSFSLLIRTLQTQGRMEILSRPQLMTLDGQSANIQVGQKFPYLNETSATFGTVTSGVVYEPTGVNLNVTPRISPDGKVLMRVNPSIETPLTQINLGGGFLGTPFAIQTVTTTVLAGDGETVAIGGLIQKTDDKTENKIPWLGDLPGVGVLFRYRQQVKRKTELLIVLTPHIVRSRLEADLILDMEAKRMDWTKVDVTKIHGSPGIEPILPPLPPYTGPGGPGKPAGPGTVLPPPALIQPSPLPLPTPVTPGEPARNEQVPAPRPLPAVPGVRTSATLPGQQAVNPAAYSTVGQAAADPRNQGPAVPPSLPPAIGNGSPTIPASKDTEKSKWSITKPWSWTGKEMD